MSYITSIGIANPANKVSQSTIAEFMVRAMRLNDDDTRKLQALFRMTGIETRYSVLKDYAKSKDFEVYPNNEILEPFPTTKRRMGLFREHALKLSQLAISDCLDKYAGFEKNSLTHLVVVSCTGMYAPGLDIDIIKTMGLASNIQRICINFMGCYAAFNALKLAELYCQTSPDASVLVVCTELCSLHFQRENTEDNMLANALFADGSAALLVESMPRKGLNLKPESFYCDIAPEGENDMAWTVGDLGFEMKLSSYVPDVIRNGIKQLTVSLLNRISQKLSDVSYFAIHPGGKKILEVIEFELGLTKEQNHYAYTILRNYGNMSSPTVLFVLHAIFQNLTTGDEGRNILSFAFGPGLTLESMLLKIEHH